MEEFMFDVYSPRWGHEDSYRVSFASNKMSIKFLSTDISCFWDEQNGPTWQPSRDKLLEAFSNDQVQASGNFVDALEHAWSMWREKKLDYEGAKVELGELFTWLNLCTKGVPKSDFWKSFF